MSKGGWERGGEGGEKGRRDEVGLVRRAGGGSKAAASWRQGGQCPDPRAALPRPAPVELHSLRSVWGARQLGPPHNKRPPHLSGAYSTDKSCQTPHRCRDRVPAHQ